MALNKLKERLGLRPDGLLQSSDGQLGDLLGVEGEIATIGVIGTGQVIQVPISNLIAGHQARKDLMSKMRDFTKKKPDFAQLDCTAIGPIGFSDVSDEELGKVVVAKLHRINHLYLIELKALQKRMLAEWENPTQIADTSDENLTEEDLENLEDLFSLFGGGLEDMWYC